MSHQLKSKKHSPKICCNLMLFFQNQSSQANYEFLNQSPIAAFLLFPVVMPIPSIKEKNTKLETEFLDIFLAHQKESRPYFENHHSKRNHLSVLRWYGEYRSSILSQCRIEGHEKDDP